MTTSFHLPRRYRPTRSRYAFHAAHASGRVARAAFALLGALLLAACNPTLNWRETRIKDTGLVVLLPCKPDEGARVVPLGGLDVSLHMTGCDAGGATFAVAHARIASASAAPDVLAQWRKATLSNMGAVSSRDVPLGDTSGRTPGGTASGPLIGSAASSGTASSGSSALTLVTAQGRRKDGGAVAMQGAWFAKDAQVFHAVVYAERISPEVTEAFFSGLRFQ